MAELAATAQQLRIVKEACSDFLVRWAVDRMIEESVDRLWGDLLAAADLEATAGSFSKFGRRLDD